jgi:hypothetical protein
MRPLVEPRVEGVFPVNKKSTALSPAMGDVINARVDEIRAQACRAFNTIWDETAIRLFESVLDLTETSPGAPSREARRMELFGLLADFLPRDSIERILAAQIVAAHTMAMDRLRLASAPELTERQRNIAFDQAMRAQNMLARLAAQHDRRRARATPPMMPETVQKNGREYTIFVDKVESSPEVSREGAILQIVSVFKNNRELFEAVIKLVEQSEEP